MDVGMRSLAEVATGDRRQITPGDLTAGMIGERGDVWNEEILLHNLFKGRVDASTTSAAGWREEVLEEQRPALAAVLDRCLAPNPTIAIQTQWSLKRRWPSLESSHSLRAGESTSIPPIKTPKASLGLASVNLS